MNAEAGSVKYAARGDLSRGTTWQFLVCYPSVLTMVLSADSWQRMTLSRPLRLLCTEMLLSLTCVYIGFIYAIFYMFVPDSISISTLTPFQRV